MDENNSELTMLQEKFRRLYKKSKKGKLDKTAVADFVRYGGIFGLKRRKQLLGLMGKSGGREGKNTKADFRFDVREQVKTSLIDLQLFIETAENKDLKNVINRETIEPLVNSILNINDNQNGVKSKLAQLLIETGFHYLQKINGEYLTNSQHQAIDEAIDQSKQLTLLTLPVNERQKYRLSVPRA